MTPQEFKLGVDFLKTVKNDFQLDKNDPGYLGFLNCGIGITDDPGFAILAKYPSKFASVMEEMGIGTEDGIREDETVFILVK
jgi:hypothetical protein